MNICGVMKTTLLDYPQHVACTLFTCGCNFRCPFCHNAELLDTNIAAEYSKEDIFTFLDKRHTVLEGIVITGGEPTLQVDLPDFIQELKKRYGLKIKLDTNGTNPSMLLNLMKEHLVDYVAMDVKAGVSNYGAASGLTECSKILRIIETSRDLLIYGDIPYEFRTTVVDGLHTEKDFYEIGSFLKGSRNYFLQSFQDRETVLNRNMGFQTPSLETLQCYKTIVEPYVETVAIRGV